MVMVIASWLTQHPDNTIANTGHRQPTTNHVAIAATKLMLLDLRILGIELMVLVKCFHKQPFFLGFLLFLQRTFPMTLDVFFQYCTSRILMSFPFEVLTNVYVVSNAFLRPPRKSIPIVTTRPLGTEPLFWHLMWRQKLISRTFPGHVFAPPPLTIVFHTSKRKGFVRQSEAFAEGYVLPCGSTIVIHLIVHRW